MTAPGPAAPPPYPASSGAPGADHPVSPYPPVPPGPHPPVPGPPPGPGAVPPFAAPPTEGRNIRLWVGLGVGALATLLCCGGGTAAVVGLLVAGTQAVGEQARAVTGDYYRALSAKQYDKAYALLCDDVQRRESRGQFERRVAAAPQVASYRLGEPELTNEVAVPVQVTFAGGGTDEQRVTLAQDQQTGGLEVCGIS